MVKVCKPCSREIVDLPLSVREDLADALARLDLGLKLSMPLSRPMPSLGKGIHELRFNDASGIYRVIYLIVESREISILVAFKKTSQQTPLRVRELVKQRLKGISL